MIRPNTAYTANTAYTFLFLGVLLVSGLACHPFASKDTRIVLITLDTLRYDSFERQGDGEALTDMPALTAWGREAAVFDRFYSATSTTQPSHASMFTGLHPWQHGVTRNGQPLAAEALTVSEILQDAGFSTAAVVASFPLSREFGYEQGFGIFDDDFKRGQRGGWSRREGEAEAAKPFFSRADTISRKAIELIDGEESGRQFFWFHYFDPHDPYGDSSDEENAPVTGPLRALEIAAKGKDPSAEVELARRLYNQDVRFMDRWIATVLDRLASDDDRFDTHIVIVADHGESFGEDGSMAHGTRLTAGQIHVPCLILSPRVAAGRRADPAGSVDIGATLLSLAGIKPGLVAGRDLTLAPSVPPRVFGMRRVHSKGARFQRLDGQRYAIDVPWFYTVLPDGYVVRGNSEEIESLPDSLSDPARQDLGEDLRRLFKAFEAELDGSFRQENLDPETREALEALGYIA